MRGVGVRVHYAQRILGSLRVISRVQAAAERRLRRWRILASVRAVGAHDVVGEEEEGDDAEEEYEDETLRDQRSLTGRVEAAHDGVNQARDERKGRGR